MIKNIVFDIGRVLLCYEPMDYIDKILADKNVHTDVHDTIFRSNEWADLDKGIISEAEALSIWSNMAPHIKKEIEKVMDNWCSILTPIEETVEILKELKLKGLKVYLLSNFHKRAFEVVSKNNHFFNLVDGMAISYRINMVKPNEDIYLYLLHEYALKPEETVFIDDTEVNVKAAQKLDINGIIFTGAEDLRDELKALGCL